MAEVPEHLLKRSAERRKQLGLGGDDGNDALTLLYAGPYTTLLMDGGPGTDTGLSPSRHTPNVTVLNCEL